MVGVVADELLDRIIAGEFPPGTSVPGELELSARHEVSRMTVREAMKTLEAQRILSVERGRGTFVNPLNRWASLEAVLRAASEGKDDASARRPADRTAPDAGKRAPANWPRRGSATPTSRRLYGHLGAMRTAAREATTSRRSWRRTWPSTTSSCKASENVFAAVLFEPLHRILEKRRTETSKVPDIQEHAIWHHQQIADALASRDPHRARDAMDAHMQQTLDDLKNYVLEERSAWGGPPAAASRRDGTKVPTEPRNIGVLLGL